MPSWSFYSSEGRETMKVVRKDGGRCCGGKAQSGVREGWGVWCATFRRLIRESLTEPVTFEGSGDINHADSEEERILCRRKSGCKD